MTTTEKLTQLGVSVRDIARYVQATDAAVYQWLREGREPKPVYFQRALKRLLAKMEKAKEEQENGPEN